MNVNQMLGLSDKDFKTVVIKIPQQEIMNSLCKKEKYQQRKKVI